MGTIFQFKELQFNKIKQCKKLNNSMLKYPPVTANPFGKGILNKPTIGWNIDLPMQIEEHFNMIRQLSNMI